MKRRWTQRRKRLYRQPDGTFKFTKPPKQKKEGETPSSKCVAEHMGGERCVEICLDPRDCSEQPLQIQ